MIVLPLIEPHGISRHSRRRTDQRAMHLPLFREAVNFTVANSRLTFALYKTPFVVPTPPPGLREKNKMNWYMEVLKKYAVFAGRARRKEYWMFFLFNFIFAFAFGFVMGLLGVPILAQIYTLALLIPGIAVSVRRMHDTDHSGWWILFPIVNIVFFCMEGKHGDNRFGSDPKANIPA